jgi:DNA-binding NtrC family response regulator
MDIRLQAKLLRAIQEREIDRVGGSAPVKVDVRILATTNRDLAAHVDRGQFRADLYFRLNVVTLHVPALSERPRDIPVLAEHFVDKFARDNGLTVPTLTPDARRALVTAAWPGNVRELENTLHRAVLLTEGDVIDADAIRPSAAFGSGPAAAAPAGGGTGGIETAGAAGTLGLIGRTVADVERDLIIDTLHHCLGNRTHAATILGISIRTLRNKLRQYTSEGFAVPMPGEGERTLA